VFLSNLWFEIFNVFNGRGFNILWNNYIHELYYYIFIVFAELFTHTLAVVYSIIIAKSS